MDWDGTDTALAVLVASILALLYFGVRFFMGLWR